MSSGLVVPALSWVFAVALGEAAALAGALGVRACESGSVPEPWPAHAPRLCLVGSDLQQLLSSSLPFMMWIWPACSPLGTGYEFLARMFLKSDVMSSLAVL